MLLDKTVAVVVPAYNEEKQIDRVLRTMPHFVDRIIVVNDCSTDDTAGVVLSYIKEDRAIGKVITQAHAKTEENQYDRAERLLKEKQQDDMRHYVPSEIARSISPAITRQPTGKVTAA